MDAGDEGRTAEGSVGREGLISFGLFKKAMKKGAFDRLSKAPFCYIPIDFF